MHNTPEHHLPNRFSGSRHRRTPASARMRDLVRGLLAPVGLLWIATLSAGCNQIFGITETTLAPRDSYTCGCTCTGGGQSFSINSNVCLPEALNPALNPNLPPDFVPPATAVQDDCHVRVERNLEQMARQCFSNRIRCSCEATADLNFSVGACFTNCFGEDLAADCSNFDPQTGDVTATNVPGQEPVCVDGKSTSTTPAALASAIFGRSSECQVDGGVTLTRDGDTQTRQTSGVTEFRGDPCPGGQCAVGVSYLLDHVDNFSFSDFGGFASVEIKNIAASGASDTGAALVDATGVGALPPASIRNTGSGKRSNQVLGGEVSSDSATFTGTNSVPLDVLVDWTNHACALSGSVLGSLEDADTAVDVNLAGTIVNEPPTASAAATARTVECTSPDATDVTLDGSASSDPENNIALFAWRRDSRTGADIGGDAVVHVTQPLGVTQPYVVAVVDTAGQASADTTAVTVLDSTAPTITSVSASPATLWPPNHKMVPVTVTASATDTCGAATCTIASITSNESVNGHGDGNTSVDWQITGPNTADVRAERSGGGSGRVYTLTVRCTDPSGNASTGTATVAVTH
jgi:hypothetical protein